MGSTTPSLSGFECTGRGLRASGGTLVVAKLLCGFPYAADTEAPYHAFGAETIYSLKVPGNRFISLLPGSFTSDTLVVSKRYARLWGEDQDPDFVPGSEDNFDVDEWPDRFFIGEDKRKPAERRKDDEIFFLLVESPSLETIGPKERFAISGFVEWKGKNPYGLCFDGCASNFVITTTVTGTIEESVLAWQLDAPKAGSPLDDSERSSLVRVVPTDQATTPIVSEYVELFHVNSLGIQVGEPTQGEIMPKIDASGDIRIAPSLISGSRGLITRFDGKVGFSEVEPWPSLEVSLLNVDQIGGQEVVVVSPMQSVADVRLRIDNAALQAGNSPTVKVLNGAEVDWPVDQVEHDIQLTVGAHEIEVTDDAGRNAALRVLVVTEDVELPSVTIDASTNGMVAPGVMVELEAVPDPDAGNYEYDWRPVVRMALGDTIGGGKTLTVAPMVTTTYQVEVRDMATGFTATATHTVEVESRMVAVTVGVEGSGAGYGEVELEGFEACLSSGCTHMVESGSVLGLVARGRENAVGEAEFTGWSCTEAGTQADTSLTAMQDVTCLATFNDVSSVCNAQAAVVLMVGGSPATSSNLNSAQVASAMVDGSGSEPDSMLTFEWSVAGPGGFSLSGTTPSLSLRTARPFGGYSASLTVRCTDDPSNSDSATLNFTVAP